MQSLIVIALGAFVGLTIGEGAGALWAAQLDAAAGALPATTLVPGLAGESLRFGKAELGPWREDAEVAPKAEAAARRAALRPWLLWAVLVGGVAGLGFTVWRLARAGRWPGRPK